MAQVAAADGGRAEYEHEKDLTMSIAAVPKYLADSRLSEASPALRFSMYLPIWTTREDQIQEIKERSGKKSREGREVAELVESLGMEETIRRLTERQTSPVPKLWKKNDGTARRTWKAVAALNKSDTAWTRRLIERQSVLSNQGADHQVTFRALSTAPFATGLGNEHPLENGFAFLNPYGLPYLPGSGVKGVVRRAAEELANTHFFGSTSQWTLPDVWRLFGFEPWLASTGGAEADWEDFVDGFEVGDKEIDRYLADSLGCCSPTYKELRQKIGRGDAPLRLLLRERKLHIRGALSFWDVIPQIKGGKLAVEIMTPHQKHYYQEGKPPHDSGQPNPISFLTIPPGSSFTFHVLCDLRRSGGLGDSWKTLLESAFAHAFDWLGFGAKTSVGYGAMARDWAGEKKARVEREEKEARAREEMRRAALSPVEREIEEILGSRSDGNAPAINVILREAERGRWTGEATIEVTRWLKGRMEAGRRWKESSAKKNPAKDRDYQLTLRIKALASR